MTLRARTCWFGPFRDDAVGSIPALRYCCTALAPPATTSSRVGGPLGSALLVVILPSNLPHANGGSVTAAPFHTTFWWLSSAAAAALVEAGWLVVEQRRVGDSCERPMVTGCSLSESGIAGFLKRAKTAARSHCRMPNSC